MFDTGLVIGKFLPPHRGHHFLIETALSQSRHLEVIVCERAGDLIAGQKRAQWLRQIHPRAQVRVVEDVYDETDSRLWADLTRLWLGRAPDAVFTSENYGHAWAKFLGCAHVLVDLGRQNVPISATQIREKPLDFLDWLHPIVRAHFVKRVVVVGAESSGTTTLARDLAAHFETNWVSEYGREYCEKLPDFWNHQWQSAEFEHIARVQNERENEAAQHANRVLICDTNSFATRLWHERYLGFLSPELDEIARQNPADVYVLTTPDIPFEQDGFRDGQALRWKMHVRFMQEFDEQKWRYILISGSREVRLKIVARLVKLRIEK